MNCFGRGSMRALQCEQHLILLEGGGGSHGIESVDTCIEELGKGGGRERRIMMGASPSPSVLQDNNNNAYFLLTFTFRSSFRTFTGFIINTDTRTCTRCC
jgi:hypothetical protein